MLTSPPPLALTCGLALAAFAILRYKRRQPLPPSRETSDASAALAAYAAKPVRTRDARAMYSVNPMNVIEERVIVAMVGLPARGKSYISKALVRHLQFLGCPTRLFNAGNRR
eukprot:6495569-Prymnesium_polylepis.1